VRVFRTISLGILIATLSACTTIAPVASPAGSGLVASPVPGTSGPSASLAPSASPVESTATETPAPTATPEPTATQKPKPSKTPKPTPTASPTPTAVAVDLSVFIQTADIPNPWYNNTDYTLPIHVALLGGPVPNAHVVVSIPKEQFSASFDTGPLAETDAYSHDVTINVPAIGPATLTLQVKAPPGYADTDKSNNKVQIAIEVQLKP
jgi:hypothetical protein